MKRLFPSACILSLTLFLTTALSAAELSVPHFFSDHMVLQREKAAAIWGQADPNAKVTVAFKGKMASVRTNTKGKWLANIETGKADAKGATLTIASGDKTVAIKDVLVGEVWFASGQSNMVFTVKRAPAYADVIAKSNFPKLRMFNAASVTAVEPQTDIEGEWTLCSPATTGGYSAVAYFFAVKLHQNLGVPVGVIKSAWGGKPVETFTSRKALNTLPDTKLKVDSLLRSDASYDDEEAQKNHKVRFAKWEETVAAWKKKPADTRGRSPKRPATPKRPLDTEGQPGVLFDSMINPFVVYTMRGAIWYQGKANAKPGAVPYDQTLPLLIRDWRERWDDDFSFYFVQLANFRAPSTEPGTPDDWALLQDRQRLILDTTPKTGMAVINDVGEEKDIHPKDKLTVGNRLALWALAKDYGKDILYCGPLYKSSKSEGNSIRVTFNQSGKGLKSKDGQPLKRFEIAGKDRKWHWAEAQIDGPDSVVVSSPEIKKPVAVRYAWTSNPVGANLINSDGLPTSVFRTDDWVDQISEADQAALKNQQERLALNTKIKALNAKRAELKRGSEQHKNITAEVQALFKKYRAMAPAK
ncbi:MAG: sialate O-acetylesterase [Pirellulales bacterium]